MPDLSNDEGRERMLAHLGIEPKTDLGSADPVLLVEDPTPAIGHPEKELDGVWCSRCEHAWWTTSDGRILGGACSCTDPQWFDLVAMAPSAQRVDITLINGVVVSAHQHNQQDGSDDALPLAVQSSAPDRWEVFPAGFGVALLVHPASAPSPEPTPLTPEASVWAAGPICEACDKPAADIPTRLLRLSTQT